MLSSLSNRQFFKKLHPTAKEKHVEWHELDEYNTKINTSYVTLSSGIPWNIPRYHESLEFSGVHMSL